MADLWASRSGLHLRKTGPTTGLAAHQRDHLEEMQKFARAKKRAGQPQCSCAIEGYITRTVMSQSVQLEWEQLGNN